MHPLTSWSQGRPRGPSRVGSTGAAAPGPSKGGWLDQGSASPVVLFFGFWFDFFEGKQRDPKYLGSQYPGALFPCEALRALLAVGTPSRGQQTVCRSRIYGRLRIRVIMEVLVGVAAAHLKAKGPKLQETKPHSFCKAPQAAGTSAAGAAGAAASGHGVGSESKAEDPIHPSCAEGGVRKSCMEGVYRVLGRGRRRARCAADAMASAKEHT